MRTATANAIMTLLRMDTTVTEEVRTAVVDVLRGRSKPVDVNVSGEASIADAAAYLGMSRTTLWRMCDRGELVSVRRGKKFYIAGAEIVRLKRDVA